MDPRIILTKLIERLEPIVGKVSKGDFGMWVDNPEEAKLYRDRSLSGWYSYARALFDARAALQSGDTALIVEAALICPTFERKGRQEAAGHAERAKRSSGGKVTAERRKAVAAGDWAPWIDLFHELVRAGMDERAARAEVTRKMALMGFKLSITGDFPSKKSIRDMLQ